ncbi:MAG: pseudouridine synthase [Clostridia bacterium]|nr:pseudouridine synthase [Clostridia bacterium]
MRLHKYIAECNIASRRAAEKMIESGRVSVNGELVREMGVDIDAERDVVEVDKKRINLAQKKYYIALNKPKGYVTTTADEFGRRAVTDLVRDIKARIYPVGRLDCDTSGLLLLTNDGAFANAIMHPSNKVNKIYIASVSPIPTPQQMDKLRGGIELEGTLTSPAKAEIISAQRSSCEVKLTIYEGKNRQVRRMFESLGIKTLSLKRIVIGTLSLGTLPEGKWRHLSEAEKNKLLGGAKRVSRKK